MQRETICKRTAQGFIIISALALFSISITALYDPQSVMDLVDVKLTNNDAFSSIRGIYGGAGMSLVFCLIYLVFRGIIEGLAFLSLLWGFYALSRIITIFSEGALGAFGRQWLLIESALFLIALALLWANLKAKNFVRSSSYEIN